MKNGQLNAYNANSKEVTQHVECNISAQICTAEKRSYTSAKTSAALIEMEQPAVN
jgi:hypothetical protein